MVADRLEQPLPDPVCGDFNDGPVSYAYQQFLPEMADVFVDRKQNSNILPLEDTTFEN